LTSPSVPVALGLAGIGAVLIASGVTGNSLSSILQGDFTRSGDTTTTTNTNAAVGTQATAGTPFVAPAPFSPGTYNAAPSSATGAGGVAIYPSLANKSMTWLLANGYTKNASGQVIAT
jgi:hypothetical protein